MRGEKGLGLGIGVRKETGRVKKSNAGGETGVVQCGGAQTLRNGGVMQLLFELLRVGAQILNFEPCLLNLVCVCQSQ